MCPVVQIPNSALIYKKKYIIMVPRDKFYYINQLDTFDLMHF